jgi:hypothetical protein
MLKDSQSIVKERPEELRQLSSAVDIVKVQPLFGLKNT